MLGDRRSTAVRSESRVIPSLFLACFVVGLNVRLCSRRPAVCGVCGGCVSRARPDILNEFLIVCLSSPPSRRLNVPPIASVGVLLALGSQPYDRFVSVSGLI